MAEGPGSWGLEGPELVKLGVRESATTIQKTPVESVDGSMIGEASATCFGVLTFTLRIYNIQASNL